MYWDHMYETDWSWLGAGSMMLFWVVIVALAVWAIVRLTSVRSIGGDASEIRDGQAEDDPETILERRLAAGDITIAEYRELVEELRHRAGV
ncbi:MAG: hypothetical protein KDC39_05920 [Actinobacteria bacterium]|nr:hypothetical protein [Actinomycetota bacterium]